jgi:predicted Zn-dependent protease
MRARSLCLLALLLAPPGSAVEEELIEHKIPPGYEPAEARDEQGLWMEFKEMERALNQSALLVKDPELNNYVQGIVCRVAAEYCNDFRVYLVRNPGFNASMTATGMMQIWTGLIVRASSTDEIAAVVGHEIAHYTRLHSLEGFRTLKSKMASASFFDLGFAVLTGVSAPIGQASAMLSYLSHNREQETEADLLGARLLAEANYYPHASYQVWEKIITEEEAAVAKNEKPNLFSQTHPASHDRAEYLKDWVNVKYGPPDLEESTDEALLTILNNNYLFLMEDMVDTNRYGRTINLLERHAEIGVDRGLVYYFYGETFRQRGQDGDQQLAMDAYRHAIEVGGEPPEVYKNLGYLNLKDGNVEQAQDSFRTYLERKPDASDRAMIEFYLEE